MAEINVGGRTMSDDIRATVNEWYELPEGAIYERYPALLSAVEKVLDIEDWEYKPAVMQGYELDQAEGYNLAMKEVRATIQEALGDATND